jgi:hypothetical protein
MDREAEDVDICLNAPGHPVTLSIQTGGRILVDVLMQNTTLMEASRQGLVLFEGDRELARRFDHLFEFAEPKSFTAVPLATSRELHRSPS